MPTGLKSSQCTSASLDIFHPLGSAQMVLSRCPCEFYVIWLAGACHWKCLPWLFNPPERESKSYTNF